MKKALITGASSGIGKEFAFCLGEMGYNLIITGRREKEIYAVKEEIEGKYGVEVEVFIIDFGHKNEFELFLEKIRKKEITFVINNAGYGHGKKFEELSYDEIAKMLDVHIMAGVRIIKNLLEEDSLQKIINVSSLASYLPTSYNGIYGGSKSFINFFTESLFIKLRKRGISVQLLLPSFTYTDFHSRQGIERPKSRGIIRWMEAGEVAKYSLKSIDKNSCLCIPGLINRILFKIFNFVPKKLYYKIAEKSRELGK